MSNEKISVTKTEQPAKSAAMPDRIPVGERNLLTYAQKRPDRYYRFCLESKLDVYLDAGYQFEHKGKAGDPRVSDGSPIDTRVSRAGGNGERLYLMWLPIELREQDVARKEAKNKVISDQIYHPSVQGNVKLYGGEIKQS